MSKYGTFSGVKVENFKNALMEIIKEYGDSALSAAEYGLDEAEKTMLDVLAKASPKKTGDFAKKWIGTGRKYARLRFIGNQTIVKSKSGDIALANILEYSTTRGKPFIKKTVRKHNGEILNAMISEIKNRI